MLHSEDLFGRSVRLRKKEAEPSESGLCCFGTNLFCRLQAVGSVLEAVEELQNDVWIMLSARFVPRSSCGTDQAMVSVFSTTSPWQPNTLPKSRIQKGSDF